MALTLAQAIAHPVKSQPGDEHHIWAGLLEMGPRLHHAPRAFFEVVAVIGVAEMKRQAITGVPLRRRTRQAQARALSGQGSHQGSGVDFGPEGDIACDNGRLCTRKNFGGKRDDCLARIGLVYLSFLPSRDQGRSKFRFDFNHGRQTHQKADERGKRLVDPQGP